MAEDIQISADTSQAVSSIGAIGKAFEEAARASGASTKAVNASLKQQERAIGGLLADVAKQATVTKAVTAAVREETTAQNALAAARERAARAAATQATGFKTNSANQVVSATTGQFASSAEAANYNKNVQARLVALRENIGLEEKLAAIRQSQAATGEASTRRQTAAYQERLSVLNKVFGAEKGLIPAPADFTKMQKFGHLLGQIPPATWTNRLTEASAKLMDMGNSARYALYDVSNSFGVAGAAIAGFGVLSVGAAIAHERAFANVERTTQTSAAGYEVLRRQLEEMSMSLPVTFDELTKIASAAGQLGIGASGVASFTSTVAKLSATTNLSSDAAGVALARFRAFFSEVGPGADASLAVTEQTFSNLASSILKVGVNSIATETGIVNVATQIASMADYAGFTANQVIGLAGALSSIGVAPELARGTMTRTFSLIGQAISSGGEELNNFAALAGVSSAEFSEAWGTDKFAGVFTSMMKGLHNVTNSGEDANLMLMDLGFNSVRDRPLLLRLAGAANEAGEAGGLLAQTMRDAYAGWVQNSELAIQYNKISKTTSARLQVLGQSFEQLAASMGQQTGGFLGEMAVQLTAVIRGFEAFSNSDIGQVLGTIAVQGAIAVGGLLLLTAAGARTVASLQGIGTAFREMTAAGVGGLGKLAGAFRVLSLSLGVVGIVASLAALVGGFVAMNDAAKQANLGVQDMGGLLGAMKQDADNGATGVTFYGEASAKAAEESRNTAEQAKGMTDALYGVEASAMQGAGGMDALAASTERTKYVFGDAAKSFYKSQLLQSEAFQKLFDPTQTYSRHGELNKFFGQALSLEDIGLDPSSLDWDQFMRDSIKGGLDADAMAQDLADELGIAMRTAEGEITKEGSALIDFSSQVGGIFGDLSPQIQAEIQSFAALNSASQATFSEIVDGSGDAATMMMELDEATQKAVDSMAQGFAKFADTSKLIGLTQTLAAGDAEAFEKAWVDAFGGASFSLQQYLDVQSRAGAEQQAFITNLGNLSARGVSDSIIAELSAMGPEANRLVQALVDGTDEQLGQFVDNFGRTGYDASVALAVQMQLGQDIVRNIMATGGADALREFNAALASGIGVDAALASLQRDIDGNPTTVTPQTQKPTPLTWAQKRLWEAQNSLTVTANVHIRTTTSGVVKVGGREIVDNGWAEGGYTGAGGKYEPAGTVHRGEFVMTAKATRNIGIGNLYAMMRAAQGGVSAPRGGSGYANGGLVSGGNSGPNVVYLSAEDRSLLRSLQPIVRIGDRDIARAQESANFRSTRQGV